MFSSYTRRAFPGFLSGAVGGGLLVLAVKLFMGGDDALLYPLFSLRVQDSLLIPIIPAGGVLGAILECHPRVERTRLLGRSDLVLKAVPYGVLGGVALWLGVLLFATPLLIITGPAAVIILLVAVYDVGVRAGKKAEAGRQSDRDLE